jgi:importin subunit alpha-2
MDVILPALLTIINIYRLKDASHWIKAVVISAGAVPTLIILLGSPHPAMAVEAVQILGCFAVDGPELRNAFIRVKLIKEGLVVSVKLEAF